MALAGLYREVVKIATPRLLYVRWSKPVAVHTIHSSSVAGGLEEFFPQTDDIIEEGELAGSYTVHKSKQY